LLGEVAELIRKQKLFLASSKLGQLEQLLSESPEGLAYRQSAEYVAQAPHHQRLRFSLQMCTSMLDCMEDGEGWSLCVERNGIAIHSRQDPDKPYTVQLKGQCIMDCPAENIAMQMNESQFFTKWVPLVKEIHTLLDVNAFDKYKHVTFSFPLPISLFMSSRDAVFHDFIVDRMEEGTWIISVRDPSPEELNMVGQHYHWSPPEPHHKVVRVNLINGGMVLRPLSRNRTEVKCMLNIDPKLLLPPSIANLLISKFSIMFVEYLIERSCMLPKEYINCHEKELYIAMRKSVDEAFPEERMLFADL